MPLYLEILDHEPSAADSALSDGADASIFDRWTSEATGGTVRLIDAPAERLLPRAGTHTARILIY